MKQHKASRRYITHKIRARIYASNGTRRETLSVKTFKSMNTSSLSKIELRTLTCAGFCGNLQKLHLKEESFRPFLQEKDTKHPELVDTML